MKEPCYQCEKREVGCHSQCEDYARMQEENRERNDKRKIESMANENAVKVSLKARKAYRRRK